MRNIFSSIDKEKIDKIYRDKSISKDVRDKLNFIINFEWDQFDKVDGLNGRASCQDSPKEFIIMRLAQYLSYNENLIFLIYEDMKDAQKEGFNPIIDKYARMMEFTDKTYFEKIRKNLRPLSPVKKALVKKIRNKLTKTKAEMPESLERQRPHESREKRVSSADYFICEISFLSLKSLWALDEYLNSHNLVEQIYENTIYLYQRLDYGAVNERR